MKTVRNILAGAAAGLALILAGQSAQAQMAQVKDPDETLKVTFIVLCCAGNVFWEPLLHGAREAARLHNIDIDFQNADFDPERNANLVQTAIANKVDGIVVMDSVEGALVDAVQQARNAGISVMTSNVETGGLAQIAYVGPDAFMQGYNLARRLIDKYGIKAGDHGLIPVCCPDQLHIDARMRGVAKAFEEAGLTFDTLTTGLIIDETQSILAGYLLAHPETAVIASTGTQGTVAQAIEEAGLERIPNGDIDVNPRVMQNIKDGLTEATSDQQPFWQGFLPVVYIAYNVRYGLIPGDMDTSAGLVDQSNAIFAESYAGTYR